MHEELIRKLKMMLAFYLDNPRDKLLIQETIAALSQPSGNSGQFVDDTMIAIALKASNDHWEASMQQCKRCGGTGQIACGDSQDYCDCGDGFTSNATEESAMRAALEAVIAQSPRESTP